MNTSHFAERHPFRFSFLLLLLFFFILAAGVAAAQMAKLPPTSFSIYSQAVLALILIVMVSSMRWWRGIGYRAANSSRDLLIYIPALVLVIGNLIINFMIGVTVTQLPALFILLMLGLLSGFTEETVFRGLMLRAFQPRGEWMAVITSTLIFGLMHAFNALGSISSPGYALVQVCYALAIGFSFSAMALRGGLIWPLVICHGLGNFASFLSSGAPGGDEVTTMLMVISAIYIVFFTASGWFLMKRTPAIPAAAGQPGD